MAGGFIQGLSKLFDAGATYLQHQQFFERLRGMTLEDAKAQLATYVRDMPDAGFHGVTIALTLFERNAKDVATQRLLHALHESLDGARGGRTSSASIASSAAAVISRLVDAPPPVRTFEEDLALVSGWADLDEDAGERAIVAHLERLSGVGFAAFRGNVAQMVENVAAEIRQHEANEDNAWGGFTEDRMSYMLASLKTGQRDPRWVARLQELQRYDTFYKAVGRAADVVLARQERAARIEAGGGESASPTLDPPEAPAAQPAAPQRASQAADPTTDAPSDTPATPDAFRAGVAMLRAQLTHGLGTGEIRADRRAFYERLLEKLDDIGARLSDPAATIDEKAKLLDRFRNMMSEFQQAYTDPGRADRLDALADGARARTLDAFIGEMKGFLYRELAQTPPPHTAERAVELMGDLTRAHQDVAALADDEAAVALEHSLLRVAAQGIHDFAHREHLMVVRPLWECAEATVSPHGLFYAGATDLGVTVHALAARLRLTIPEGRGKYYAQARWDSLRSCHVGVFDLRGHRSGLLVANRDAAVAQASAAYELGLALALGKPVVVVTQPGDALPFDVDLAPCAIAADAPGERALADAIDSAWYGRQRTSSASCLADTWAFIDRETQSHPRRAMLETSHLLSRDQIDDAIGFAGSLAQILRERGLTDLQAVRPAWPGRYPDPAAPSLFHVMPFSEPWSDAVRDSARGASTAGGYAYRRGDEADEGRIIQAIWDDICGAHVVLVDLSGLNLNVLIELGMAHAVGRTVLTVRHAGLGEPLPRNIEKLRVVDYDGPAGLASLLQKRLRQAPGRPG